MQKVHIFIKKIVNKLIN